MCLNYTFTFSFTRFLISPLFYSQNSPIYPRIDFLADFWSSHLRNEFTWCYANPTISYSYISMNDCRSWSRLIEFPPRQWNRQLHWVSYFTLPSSVWRKSALSWSDMPPSDGLYLLSHFSSPIYFTFIDLMRTIASCSHMKCFPNEHPDTLGSDHRTAKLCLNSGREKGSRKEDGVRSQDDSRKWGVDRQ